MPARSRGIAGRILLAGAVLSGLVLSAAGASVAVSGISAHPAAIALQDTTAPTAEAGSDNFYPVGTRVRFDGSASADNVGIVSYVWSVVYDGTPIQLLGRVANFTFSLLGVYNVTLRVADAAGNSDVDWRILTIHAGGWDSDRDGLLDIWEFEYFGNLSQDASGDFDGDGFTNGEEYNRDMDPTVPDEPPSFLELYFWPILGLGALAVAALLVGRWAFRRGHVRGKEEQRVRSAIEEEIEEVLEEEAE